MSYHDIGDLPPEHAEDEPGETGFDASDPAAVKRKRRSSELRKQQKKEFLSRVLTDPIGRQWLAGLLGDCHTFEQRFGHTPAGAASPEATWMFLGEREVGLRLLRTIMAANPQLGAVMLSEMEGFGG